MSRNCILIDERDPLNLKTKQNLKINKDALKLDEVFNLRHKRRQIIYMPEGTVAMEERVKYAAIEGSSLTLLGLIRYNVQTD